MKYALIGCGRISVNHIKAALNNNLEIIAVCDILTHKMDAMLEKFNLKNSSIKRYTDYNEMIKNERPEIVSIATESGLHAKIALDCIEKGVNLIIEKPMAMSIEDADKIIALANKKNVKVSACHQNRFNLAIQELRKAVETGRFGKLSHGSIHVRWNRDHGYYDQASWRGTWEQDGGALMNQCIHGIDLLRWMMGDEIEEIYGATRQQFHDYLEAEDVGMAVVKFKNGAIGTIEGTTNVYPKNLEETLKELNVKIGCLLEVKKRTLKEFAKPLRRAVSHKYTPYRPTRSSPFPGRCGPGRRTPPPGIFNEGSLKRWYGFGY